MVTESLTFAKFNELLEKFRQIPTLANYIRLRRTSGISATDSYRFFSLDIMLPLEGELRKYKIDRRVVAKVLDGNDLMIDELCLQIMERIEARRMLESKGRNE